MALRSLRASDIESLSSWLLPLAAQLECERWTDERALRDAIGANDALLFTDDAGQAFVSYEKGAPLLDSARVDLLAVARDDRCLGIGSRAALALERRLRRSAPRIYIGLPQRFGLALYFWLRLGYRPLTQGEWPANEEATSAWMVRDLR
jgi:GNAT superfamily N-acetyltransferase